MYGPFYMGGLLWGLIAIWPYYVLAYQVVKKVHEPGFSLSSFAAAPPASDGRVISLGFGAWSRRDSERVDSELSSFLNVETQSV